MSVLLDMESCSSLVPDFTYLADNSTGYTVTQTPAAGSTFDGSTNSALEILLQADNGSDVEQCTFLAMFAPPLPTVPQDAWIAYCYNGKHILNQDVFRGYYHEPNLDISSWQLWDIGVSPSWHPQYIGCDVEFDQHTVVYRRRGFPSGTYQLDILNHDNEVRLYIDEALVFGHDGFNLQHYDVFTGFLDNASLVEFEWNEGIGGSLGVLDLNLLCPTDTLIYATESCQGLMPDLRWAAVPGGSVTQSIAPGTPLDVGSYQLTMTSSDALGWTETCSQTIYVIDTIPPVIDAPASLDVPVNSNCSYILENLTELYPAADNCGLGSYEQMTPQGTLIEGNTTIELIAQDVYGNLTQHFIEIIPTDTTPPQATCLANAIVDLGSNCEYIVENFENQLQYSDNCGVNSIQQIPAVGSTINMPGNYTVQFVVTDAGGLTTTCSMLLEVTDNQAPVINCTANLYLALDSNCEALLPDYTSTLTYQDNCTNSITLMQSPAPGTQLSGAGVVNLTFTITDAAGNTDFCTSALHLQDTSAPQIVMPVQVNREVDNNCEYALENIASWATITDNCTVSSITQYPPIGTLISLSDGDVEVTLTATDVSGNSNEATVTIHLSDGISPEVDCPTSLLIYPDETCGIEIPNVLDQSTIQDNCSIIDQEIQEPAPGIYTGFFPDNIVISVTDSWGNASSCTTTLNYIDTISPSLSGPTEYLFELDDNCAFSLPDLTPDFQATDNCIGTLEISQSPSPQTVVDPTTLDEVTITAIDEAGNTVVSSASVTFQDLTPPTLTCPAPLQLEVEQSCSAVLPDMSQTIDIIENCSYTGFINQEPPAGTLYTLEQGFVEIVFTLTDDNGNTGTCATVVNLTDLQPPVFEPMVNLTFFTENQTCGTTVEFQSPIATDNCGETTISQTSGPVSGEWLDVGTYEVSFEATDNQGNIAATTFEIEVIDNQPPTLACDTPNDILYLGEGDCDIVYSFNSPQASDNCIVQNVQQIEGPISGSNVPPGTHAISFVAIDASGLSDTCSFTVEVLDTLAPSIQCPESIAVPNASGFCGAWVDYDVSASDNCSDLTLHRIQGNPGGSYFPAGLHEIVYEAIDPAGNTSTCSFTIEVFDEEAPEIWCPPSIVSNNPSVAYNLPMATDNCDDVEVMVLEGLPSGSNFPPGLNTVEFLALDPSGNSATCILDVYINSAPVAVPHAVTTHLNYINLEPLKNDYDPDGDPILLLSADLPENARLEYDHTISYFPDKERCRDDSISYVIQDVHGLTDTSYILIQLLCPENLVIPEGFSPNNDGINDQFVIEGLDDFTGCTLNVFNEQGVRVFFSEAYKNDWDGYANTGILSHRALPSGKYYYILEIPYNSLIRKGYTLLNR
ncbi:MAG: HYR domain-containing protein [Flavobacteriales bacterium]|nr:HYR domain-containing protein [Flavobacteriales bacterium]